MQIDYYSSLTIKKQILNNWIFGFSINFIERSILYIFVFILYLYYAKQK